MAETTEPEPKTITTLAHVEASTRGLVLNNLEDMKTVSQIILQSKLAPDSFKTSEQIFVGLQAGAEVGLKPMQSLNSIVVIKGKPTLWGDAALALVKRSGLSEYCHEYYELVGVKVSEENIQYTEINEFPENLVAVCKTKRKGEDEPVVRSFSVADAKLARLWKKPGPWTTHPKRMLKYKARAFNLRDNFPDVLFGMHLTEEMYGEEPLPAPESDVPPRDERRKMAVPSSTVDTTRAPVKEAEPIPGAPGEIYGAKKQLLAEEAEGPAPAPAAEEKPEPESKMVTFQCPKCLRTYQYGKEEGKGLQCECHKGVIVEQGKPEPADEEEKKTKDVKTLYIEVNAAFVALNGKDFIAFTAYVLCLDENEISPGSLTIDQLKQVKAYIETSGVTIA